MISAARRSAMVFSLAGAGEVDHPADAELGGTTGVDLHGDLVGSATDALGLDLKSVGLMLSMAFLKTARASSPVFSATISNAL